MSDQTDTQAPETTNHRDMTVEIVSAFVANNSLEAGELPQLIASVGAALAALTSPAPQAPAPAATPAVNPKRSVFPDHLISLEDGKPYKSLKRHLGRLGLTPAQYRAKWGLPSDYPMTAQSYSAKRAELARSIGLGRKSTPRTHEQQPAPSEQTEAAE